MCLIFVLHFSNTHKPHVKIPQDKSNLSLWLNMFKCEACSCTVSLCSIFSLFYSLLCVCIGFVPSYLFCVPACVCEIFMHCSGDALWEGSSGERQHIIRSRSPTLVLRPSCAPLPHPAITFGREALLCAPSSFQMSFFLFV